MGMKGRSTRKHPAGGPVATGLIGTRNAPKLRVSKLRVWGKKNPSVMMRVHVDFANMVRTLAVQTGDSTTTITRNMVKRDGTKKAPTQAPKK